MGICNRGDGERRNTYRYVNARDEDGMKGMKEKLNKEILGSIIIIIIIINVISHSDGCVLVQCRLMRWIRKYYKEVKNEEWGWG